MKVWESASGINISFTWHLSLHLRLFGKSRFAFSGLQQFFYTVPLFHQPEPRLDSAETHFIAVWFSGPLCCLVWFASWREGGETRLAGLQSVLSPPPLYKARQKYICSSVCVCVWMWTAEVADFRKHSTLVCFPICLSSCLFSCQTVCHIIFRYFTGISPVVSAFFCLTSSKAMTVRYVYTGTCVCVNVKTRTKQNWVQIGVHKVTKVFWVFEDRIRKWYFVTRLVSHWFHTQRNTESGTGSVGLFHGSSSAFTLHLKVQDTQKLGIQ